MANVTLNIDDALLRRARIRALEQGTTVNALVRQFLERFARDDAARAMETILAIAERSKASSGSGGRTWTRDDIYDR
jgi:plasmid stability protein